MPSIITASTASNTALNFSADTSGVLEIRTGSSPTTAMTIDGSQNVGIGTSSPESRLHINVDGTALRITRGSGIGFLFLTGTGSTEPFRLQAQSGSIDLYTAAAQPITFTTNTAERMRITSGGDVLIGKTAAYRGGKLVVAAANVSQTSTLANLQVTTTDTQAANVGGSIGLGGQVGGGDETPFGYISGRKETSTSGNYAGYLAFATQDSGAAVAERMRIDSSGNVGIGVASLVSPGASRRLLQIANSTNGAQIALGSSTSESNNPRIFSGQFDLGFAAGVSTGILNFFTNDTERMRIDSAGRVTMPFQPMASVHSNTAGWNPAVGTVVPFDLAQVNTGSNYNTSTYRFTCPVAGRYLVTVWVLFRGTASSVGIYRNGSQVQGRGAYAQVGSGVEAQGVQTLIVNCAANDFIDARRSQAAGGGDIYLFDLAGMQITLLG